MLIDSWNTSGGVCGAGGSGGCGGSGGSGKFIYYYREFNRWTWRFSFSLDRNSF